MNALKMVHHQKVDQTPFWITKDIFLLKVGSHIYPVVQAVVHNKQKITGKAVQWTEESRTSSFANASETSHQMTKDDS